MRSDEESLLVRLSVIFCNRENVDEQYDEENFGAAAVSVNRESQAAKGCPK
jgi:hypothetical protein